jgi:hypothetical protein
MERIAAVEKFLRGLKAKRDEIVNLLLWEICKNSTDAAKEVDRTIKYVEDTIKALKVRSGSAWIHTTVSESRFPLQDLENSSNKFVSDSGVVAQIRRSPIGVSLCCGPMNYVRSNRFSKIESNSCLTTSCCICSLSMRLTCCCFPLYLWVTLSLLSSHVSVFCATSQLSSCSVTASLLE